MTPLWKSMLLNAYRHGTSPLRRAMLTRAARAGRAPVMVVYYHRVADDGLGEWTFPTALFQRQVDWMRRRFDMVSLAEAQARLRVGNARACVSITFDDGYAANCQTALPWLAGRGIPCTYFVSTRNVTQGVPFPHDVARGVPLPANNIAELRDMSRDGVEIGCHTRTHADLGRIRDPDALFDEVVTAGNDLQSAIGQRVRYFAFPYGLRCNLNALAFRLAAEHGYEGVCSAYGGYNWPGDDPFHLQRIPADHCTPRLQNWLSLDPRKLRVPRFDVDVTTMPRAWEAATA
jgi:peptidoglycan/xylan/chitin deacetylase (PgdA/CDA1 family)